MIDAWWTRFWQRPRQPCAGLAVAAMAGIGLADWLDGDPWKVLGGFLALTLIFAWRPRVWLCWLVIAATFGTLHLFQVHAVPAETLARLLPSAPHIVRAVGIVADEPRQAGTNTRFVLRLERIELDGRSWESHAPVAAAWKDAAAVACGDRVEFTGTARNIASPRNPGEFDYAAYERRQGIRSEFFFAGVNDARVIGRDGSPVAGLRRAAARFHDWMLAALNQGLEHDPAAGAVVTTMLMGLGENPGLGDTEEIFQRTGTLHFFAIDGLKLAFLTAMASWALVRCGLPGMWAKFVCLPALAFYAMATGLGPASLRATLMASALLGAYFLERPLRPLNGLGLAAAVILFFDTNQLFSLGFQLSFAVVLALVILAGPLHGWLMRFWAPDPFLPRSLFSGRRLAWEWFRLRFWALTSVSLAAWLGSLPWMIRYFHVVSPISPLANVVVFPMAWSVLLLDAVALLGAGLFSWGSPALTHGWAWIVNGLNGRLAGFLLMVVRGFDAVPGGSHYVAPMHWPVTAPMAEVTVLDLGRERAMHLRAGGEDWMIDAAHESSYLRGVRPFLRWRGVNAITGLILGQPDAHHIAGAPWLMRDYPPARACAAPSLGERSPNGRQILRLLAGQGRTLRFCQRGDVIALPAGAELRALYPPADMKRGRAADRALVLQLRSAGWRMLFLEDGGEDVTRWLFENSSADVLRSDVLVTGAPPGEMSSPTDFVRAVAPRLIVQQHATGTEGTTTESGVPVISQDKSGAVTLRVYADRIEASGFIDERVWTLRH